MILRKRVLSMLRVGQIEKKKCADIFVLIIKLLHLLNY